MRYADTLVSIGLPVRNGADRIEGVVKSVLNQDHENLELVICDNASTDGTGELCRDLAAQDSRIVYHRHAVNVGLLNNFVSALRLATGTFYCWLGDDDWLDPRFLSRSLDAFAADDRLLLVTTQVCYTGPDGVTRTPTYNGIALRSDDPVTRFTEMLRLVNEGDLVLNPAYGLFRREPVLHLERRNFLGEDEVFATKLALAGPWGHVPEVLGWRNWNPERPSILARKLDVPSWQTHFRTVLQSTEMLRWLDKCDLDQQQRRRAQLAVARMCIRRQRKLVASRGRKLLSIAGQLAGRPPARSHQPDATRRTAAASRSVAVPDGTAAKS